MSAEEFDIHRYDKKAKYRRKKAYENVGDLTHWFSRNFDPDATGDKGLWCGTCRRRSKWKELLTKYELKSGDLFRLWFCPACENLIRSDNITDLGYAHEAEEREKNMDLSGQKARMDALEKGVERDLGMTMVEYTELTYDHPKRAAKILEKAIAKAQKRDKKRRKEKKAVAKKQSKKQNKAKTKH